MVNNDTYAKLYPLGYPIVGKPSEVVIYCLNWGIGDLILQ